ncbi:hypothetical protein EYF80_030061 [Liparis tanakae]|uniref:Uncharacterized protein n=1 Tax=Liparis tanakae TaxID=230148 RepID=A0A4Z2H2K7_9TELE|nr:hypothetical protein EYF80_030061 [Liparis tanakae]
MYFFDMRGDHNSLKNNLFVFFAELKELSMGDFSTMERDYEDHGEGLWGPWRGTMGTMERDYGDHEGQWRGTMGTMERDYEGPWRGTMRDHGEGPWGTMWDYGEGLWRGPTERGC